MESDWRWSLRLSSKSEGIALAYQLGVTQLNVRGRMEWARKDGQVSPAPNNPTVMG